MSHKDLVPSPLADILDSIGGDTRFNQQLRLENLLLEFHADAQEASELLCCLLKRWEGNDEISLCRWTLECALDREEKRQGSNADDCAAWHERRALREGD